jgi:hypothetical protein
MRSLAVLEARGALFVANHRFFGAHIVAFSTRNTLLVVVAAFHSPGTSAWVAVNVTVPALIIVIQFPDASMVATPGKLLVYVIAPLLALVGRVVIANAASPSDFLLAMIKLDNIGVGKVVGETVSTLLVTVIAAYSSGTCAWDAKNVTVPTLCNVIKFPDASMVATPGLLLVYVMAPLLLLAGRADIGNAALPSIFELATVKADIVGVTNVVFNNMIDPTYILNGTPNTIRVVMTLLFKSSTLVPSNVYAAPLTVTVSPLFSGM